jgi:hypothetical protein
VAINHEQVALDFLRDVDLAYLESDGVCFSPVFSEEDGICILSVFFQNRYTNPFEGSITLMPGFTSSGFRFGPFTVRISGEGGAFGVVRQAVVFPSMFQGQQCVFKLYAGFKFPRGQGGVLRTLGGVKVGGNSTKDTLFTVFLALFGALYIPETRITLVLPRGIASELPANSEATTTIFWKPGMPLLPRQRAAQTGER